MITPMIPGRAGGIRGLPRDNADGTAGVNIAFSWAEPGEVTIWIVAPEVPDLPEDETPAMVVSIQDLQGALELLENMQ